MSNTLEGSKTNKEMEKVLLDVIESLQDGQNGFAHLGEHVKDEVLKARFLQESLTRAQFRGDLELELHRAGVADVKASGSVSGALHRSWADLKAKLGADDHSLLESAEQGEDVAKKAYKDALDHELPGPIRQVLTSQYEHVLASHDYVKAYRDSLAAAK